MAATSLKSPSMRVENFSDLLLLSSNCPTQRDVAANRQEPKPKPHPLPLILEQQWTNADRHRRDGHPQHIGNEPMPKLVDSEHNEQFQDHRDRCHFSYPPPPTSHASFAVTNSAPSPPTARSR